MTGIVLVLVACSPVVVYQKEEAWGPCIIQDGCKSFTSLYSDGRLVVDGNEYQVTSMSEVVRLLNGIIDKNCEAYLVADYWATTTINVDGWSRSIEYPGCEDELATIDTILAQYTVVNEGPGGLELR